jgi:putative inorganic carbon (HCO3(-)) transporter
VIAAAAIAHLYREATGFGQVTSSQARPIEIALAVFISLYALQSLYTNDLDTAFEQMVFFYVPFALLAKLLAEVRWTRPLLLGCGAVLLGLALVFVGIGFWEYHRRELLWNPKVISANQFESYFRVNSVFWDPNVYGRFLIVVILAVAGVMLWNERGKLAVGAAVVLAVLWAGLVLTFSQSSFASLLVGLAVLAALRWNVRRTLVVSAVGLGLGGLFVLAFQDTLRLHLGSSSGLNKATSGRSDLIKGGVNLFADRLGLRLGIVRPHLSARAEGQPGGSDISVPHVADHGCRRAGGDRRLRVPVHPGGLVRAVARPEGVA